MPFAAFFVAFLLLLCIPDGSRKLAVCLLLGALAGLCADVRADAVRDCAVSGAVPVGGEKEKQIMKLGVSGENGSERLFVYTFYA